MKISDKIKLGIASGLVAVVASLGCTTTETGIGVGALGGGAIGAIGARGHRTTERALIGAGVGAVAGGIIGHIIEEKQRVK